MPFRNPFSFVRPRARAAVSGVLALLVFAGLAWANHGVTPTVACADSPPATLMLSIDSGVTREGNKSRIEVQAYPDGCVAVHRPWFLRDAGDYEVRLSAQEQLALKDSIAIDALRSVDQKTLEAQTKNMWVDSTNSATIFADLDNDLVTLRWDDGGTTRQLVASGAQKGAAGEASADGLDHVARAIGALRTLSTHAGTRVLAEKTP